MDYKLRQQFRGFLETPQILTEGHDFPFPSYFIDRSKVNTFPGDLEIPRTMVLGKRMEEFFKYFIAHYTTDQLLAHSQQIIQNKQTLGELDFLLRNSISGEVSHVELIYKFFLYDPDVFLEEDKWTGPNHRDSLSRKKRHLLDKQFPLLHRKETKEILSELDLTSDQVAQKVCFKANFFIPWDFEQKKIESKYGFPVQGRWIRIENFTGKTFEKAHFFSPKKKDWPVLPKDNTQWVPYFAILEQITPMLKRSQSPLVWMKTPENEYSRFFIVWW